ncbi:ATP-binding protein, partial [Planktothrix sp. FACHB-1355]
LAKTVELRQEVDNPYIIGVPLKEQQEIFTGRTHFGTRIEQLILDRRRPPLLLYGQRRMGKTSLLNNLGRLLPNSIIPMFVDLQGPVSSASDYAGFLYNIARAMTDSAKRQSAVTLPPLTRETLKVDPFTSFDEWLDNVEQTLDQNIALLSFDEFEALDTAISKGRFDEQDVLGMLRHLIQHRPRFKLLLAGSHTIEEFQRWASYLINVQVLHISYLKEPEARQLIERPVKDFTLRYEPDAVERVLQLTRCHPFLVQLLCAEIIYLKNEQDPSVRRLANLADVEAAVPAALNSGSFFFADIQNNQVDAAGLALLRFIAAQGEGATVSREVLSRQFADNLDSILELLLRRELIEEIGEGYRFQVELIRCWFARK